jgi:hypothetical protein
MNLDKWYYESSRDESDFSYEVAERIWLSLDRSFEFEFEVIAFESDAEDGERLSAVVIEFDNGRKFYGSLLECRDWENLWETDWRSLTVEEIE